MTELTETSVEILGRTYPMRCPAEEVATLREAARLLESKMREFRTASGVVKPEMVGIMAGLNIACELVRLRQDKGNELQQITHRLYELGNRIGHALHPCEQLEAVPAE